MSGVITSAANGRVKQVNRLRTASGRCETGLILIDGRREIERALQSGVVIREFYVSESELSKSGDEWSAVLKNHSCPIVAFSDALFDKICYGNRNDGVLALADLPLTTLHLLKKTQAAKKMAAPLVAVIEGVEKPGNIGAMLRSADGAGLDALLLADPQTDLFNPNIIRNSMGTVFSMPTAVATASEIFEYLVSQKIRIAVARCDGAIPYSEFDFRPATAIVVGSEAHGLTDLWRGPNVTAIAIPMHGIADSLNVAGAATVLFYEAQRQRTGR